MKKDEFTIADLDAGQDNVDELVRRSPVKPSVKEKSKPKRLADEETITTISLNKEVFKELKYLAIQNDTNVRELMREAASDLLEKYRG